MWDLASTCLGLIGDWRWDKAGVTLPGASKPRDGRGIRKWRVPSGRGGFRGVTRPEGSETDGE